MNKNDRGSYKAHLVPNTVNTTYSAIPWYLGGGNDLSMAHQKSHSALRKAGELAKLSKGSGKHPSALRRWHPGSCENCGSETHKAKDCIELPRKRSAKYAVGPAYSTSKAPATKAGGGKKSESVDDEIKKFSEKILSNAHNQQAMGTREKNTSGYTMRDCEDMPVYLQDSVIAFDPRTHAVKHDVFKQVGENQEKRQEALQDAKSRLEALKKYQIIADSGALPSNLDSAYSEEK